MGYLLEVFPDLFKAEPLCQRTLQILELERGKSHSEYGIALDSLGKLRIIEKKYDEASKNVTEFSKCDQGIHLIAALDVKQASLGSDHYDVAVTLCHLATLGVVGSQRNKIFHIISEIFLAEEINTQNMFQQVIFCF